MSLVAMIITVKFNRPQFILHVLSSRESPSCTSLQTALDVEVSFSIPSLFLFTG